jgi:hypothetical protein
MIGFEPVEQLASFFRRRLLWIPAVVNFGAAIDD